MAPRTTRPPKDACRTCPMPPPTRPTTIHVPAFSELSTPGQGDRLWRHLLFGTGTLVSMIEGYANLGMPGLDLNSIASLRDRLSGVIANITEKQNATAPAEE